MFFRISLIFLLSLFASCQRGALYVYQQKITPSYLASTNVATPDPRTPPNGQMIVMEYIVPRDIRMMEPKLKLSVLFKDFSETVVEYPLRSRFGVETYSVLNENFKETGGFLAYRAEILTADGEVYADWKHQLWVKLIDIDDTNSAAAVKSRQLSVIDTPGWS